MSKVEKDIRSREFTLNEDKNMRQYNSSNLWIQEKELSFHKYEGASVEIFNNKVSEYFTFTPQFGRFEGFIDVFDYIEFWLKENDIPINSVDVTIDELSALIYKIDLDTLELGEEKERISGRECVTYSYREEEKVFFDLEKEEDIKIKEWGWYEVFNLEEDDNEDIDPQF